MESSNLTEKIATYKDVGILLLKYLPKISKARDRLAEEFAIDEDVEPSDDAESFADDLEDLGPTFVKIGQLLSTRSDLLPKNWIAALQRLQDDVEPVSYEDIRSRVETELGAKIDRLFDRFDETPLASASLGQVHSAQIRNGGPEVVVKVQRPEIRERVARELEAIQHVADFLHDHSDFGQDYDLDRMVAQFRKAILDELNYLSEAENLVRLGQNLRELPNIIVPSPIQDYCSTGVLTMDRIDGAKVTDLSGVVKAEVDGEALADELFHAYLKQILIDGFFHADPHPGNVLLTRDRRLALIDLGMVGTVSDGTRDHLLQLLGAISEGKSEAAVTVARDMGTPRDDYNPEAFAERLKALVDERQSTRVEDLKVGDLVMKVTEICGEEGLRIPNSLFMIGKMLMNLDMIGKSLAPDFNPDSSIRRHLSGLAHERLDHHLSIGSVVHYLTDLKELFAETPSRINSALDKISQNELSLEVRAIDEAKLLKGFHRVANRITVGIILAAMIVGASMMMNIEAKFTLFGYPGLAMIFFLIAAIGGLIMVGRIMFGSESE